MGIEDAVVRNAIDDVMKTITTNKRDQFNDPTEQLVAQLLSDKAFALVTCAPKEDGTKICFVSNFGLMFDTDEDAYKALIELFQDMIASFEQVIKQEGSDSGAENSSRSSQPSS